MKASNTYSRIRLNAFAVLVALLAAYVLSLFVSLGDVFAGTPTIGRSHEGADHLVNSGPPVLIAALPDITSHCAPFVTIDLSAYFMDPDGDAIAYSAEAADNSIAFVTVSGDTLTLRPRTVGQSEISVIATDSIGGSATAYDVLGRQVSALRTAHFAPGTYSVTWNASTHPSGVYFVRLEAGAFSATRQVILLE